MKIATFYRRKLVKINGKWVFDGKKYTQYNNASLSWLIDNQFSPLSVEWIEIDDDYQI